MSYTAYGGGRVCRGQNRRRVVACWPLFQQQKPDQTGPGQNKRRPGAVTCRNTSYVGIAIGRDAGQGQVEMRLRDNAQSIVGKQERVRVTSPLVAPHGQSRLPQSWSSNPVSTVPVPVWTTLEHSCQTQPARRQPGHAARPGRSIENTTRDAVDGRGGTSSHIWRINIICLVLSSTSEAGEIEFRDTSVRNTGGAATGGGLGGWHAERREVGLHPPAAEHMCTCKASTGGPTGGGTAPDHSSHNVVRRDTEHLGNHQSRTNSSPVDCWLLCHAGCWC